MTTRHLAALIVAGLATSAAAQTPQVALDVFLEQRVAEELAADGTILSRMGVALDVELVGDKTLVSLVDPATRRAIASTKLDTLPADREAAVATVMQVVANLTSQLTTTNSTAVAVKTALEEERQDREKKELAKEAYAREAIRFGDVPIVESDGKGVVTTTLSSIPYRGDRRLSPPEFFEIVERKDLKDSYEARRTGGIAAAVIGFGASLGGSVITLTKGVADQDFGNCNITSPSYDSCREAEDARYDERKRDAKKWVKIGIGVSIGGLVVGLVGIYYARHANPISESEAHDLADQYNAKVRAKHGLPAVTQRAKRFQDVALAPYADEGGGGVTLTGRF
jgi:hypothetical protein